MTDDFQDFQHLLENTQAVLEDLQKTEVKLHSSNPTSGAIGQHASTGAGPAISFATHTPTERVGQPLIQLASKLKEHQETIKDYHDASSDKRLAMWASPDDRIKLYSIIFAEYRPASPFNSGHALASNALSSRIGPGGQTWDDILKGQPLAAWARHAVRLNNAVGVHQGSGTLMADGRILTAWHVLDGPGHVFGPLPAPPGTTGLAACNQVFGGAAMGLTISGHQRSGTLDACWIDAAQAWPGAFSGSEFAANSGLPLQTTPLTAAELAGRKVVIIGHPGGPGTTSDAALAPIAFPDGCFGFKRLMPGTLHPTNPLGTASDGVPYLRHDCSTLGGASGGCLIDLLTGVILGVHVSGKTSTENRNGAVPAWLIDSDSNGNLA